MNGRTFLSIDHDHIYTQSIQRKTGDVPEMKMFHSIQNMSYVKGTWLRPFYPGIDFKTAKIKAEYTNLIWGNNKTMTAKETRGTLGPVGLKTGENKLYELTVTVRQTLR